MSLLNSVHPTAVISPDAEIGANVVIGSSAVIHGNVKIGHNTRIDEFCVIGSPTGTARNALVIGANSRIRSHSVIYEGSDLGDRLETGHFVLIRAGATVGTNLRIGSYSSLEGQMEIGKFARLQGNVQIGPGTRIGNFVSIFSLVTATNDPLPPSHVFRPVTLNDGVVVAVGATLMPGVNVGRGSFIAAGARPTGDIPAGVFITAEGQIGGPINRLMDLETGTRHPWMQHFADAYPEDAQVEIAKLRDAVDADARQWRLSRNASK